jgi:hypothetical protein
LRVLLVRRKEWVLHHKAAVSSQMRVLASSMLSRVSFRLSPSVIAVHNDSSIEPHKFNETSLSPVFCPKAENTGDKCTTLLVTLSQLRRSESSRKVEFDGIAAARAPISATSHRPTTLMETTEVFLPRPLAIIAALSWAGNEQCLNSSLVTAVPSVTVVHLL